MCSTNWNVFRFYLCCFLNESSTLHTAAAANNLMNGMNWSRHRTVKLSANTYDCLFRTTNDCNVREWNGIYAEWKWQFQLVVYFGAVTFLNLLALIRRAISNIRLNSFEFWTNNWEHGQIIPWFFQTIEIIFRFLFIHLEIACSGTNWNDDNDSGFCVNVITLTRIMTRIVALRPMSSRCVYVLLMIVFGLNILALER